MLIQKDNLTIRSATIADAVLLGGWWRDGKVMAHAGFPLGLNISDDDIAVSLSKATDAGRILIIEVGDVPIGEMSYRTLPDNTAEIGIKICDFVARRRGYGTKFINMLVCELFTNFAFERIILDTNINNIPAQKTYEKLGFHKIDVRHDSWRNQLGELQSSVDYELLKAKYAQGCRFSVDVNNKHEVEC